jgi:hypothetical protein
MTFMKSTQSLFSDSAAADDAAADRVDPASPVWHRFLDEFRNSPSERKARGLTELVALVDASNDVSTEPVVAPLGCVVDRAVRLAVPVAGRRTAIVVNVPKTSGVRNRGTALEGMLAALIVDLAAAQATAPGAECDLAGTALVRVDADIDRRGLAIEVSCAGARLAPSSPSWRLSLARELAAKLGATLTVAPEVSTYVVRFAVNSL